MFIIYHDPSCVFSHACLVLLRYSGKDYKKVKYLKEPFTRETLKEVIEKLAVHPVDLVQTDNKNWQCLYSDLDLGDEEIIQILIENQEMLIKPIIVSGNKAVVGRPPKNLITFLKENKKNKNVSVLNR